MADMTDMTKVTNMTDISVPKIPEDITDLTIRTSHGNVHIVLTGTMRLPPSHIQLTPAIARDVAKELIRCADNAEFIHIVEQPTSECDDS
jgi:hypothetical protein